MAERISIGSTGRRRGSRAVCVLGSVALIVTTATACDAAPSTPVPHVATTSSDSQAPNMSSGSPVDRSSRQERIDEAKERYASFAGLFDQIAQDSGRDGFARMLETGYLGSPAMQATYQSYWDQYTNQKLVQTGARVIASIVVTDFEGDSDAEPSQTLRIWMDVCLDTTKVAVTFPDGHSALLDGYPTRTVQEVVMQTQPDGHWSVNEETSTQREC